MQKERGLEFKVGVLILGAAAILVGFVFILGNFSVGKGYHLYVDYTFSGNIQPGAPVKVSGIKVGKVEDVLFYGGRVDDKTGRRVQVRLKVWVEERVKETIREDAEFFVNTAGVLGEQYLEIAPGSYERAPLPPGSIVVGVDPPRTDLIVARLYEFLDSTTRLLKDDKDLLKNLLKDSASMVHQVNGILIENRAEIGQLIASSDRLFRESADLLQATREGLGDPKIVGKTIADLDATLVSANRALGELTPRAVRLADEGTRTLALVTDARVERAMGAVDSANKLMVKSVGLVDGAGALVFDLRSGKGTAGKLLAREEVYADIKEMIRDLKRNPWKFFWKE